MSPGMPGTILTQKCGRARGQSEEDAVFTYHMFAVLYEAKEGGWSDSRR